MEESEPKDEKNIRLGSLALKSGWVTPEQLREALGTQAREVTDGKMPRQLGLILLSMGALTGQQLQNLLAKQAQLRKGTEVTPPERKC